MSDQPDTQILGCYKQLVEILQELASILNIDQLLERSVKAVVGLCKAEHAMLFMPDHSSQRLWFKTGSFPNPSRYRQVSVPIDLCLEGWVLKNKSPLLINNFSGYDPHYGSITNPAKLNVKSLICVALVAKDIPIGVIEVFRLQPGNFTPVDQEILTTFANQIAIYIVNSQLFLQSDLVAELVHELRTPLVSLNLAVHLLQRTDLEDDKRERIFEMISTEFNRLSDMTTSFLDYARLESGRTSFNPTSFDVNQMLRESVEMMQFQADARSIKIILQSPAEPLILSGDRDRIKQVILNLLNNAIKYNRLGGKVVISAQRTPTDFSIAISDDGQGISEEYLPRLFTRFFRAPNQENQTIGTGLGLTICKQIVEAHHGKLDVTSTVDKGSTFTVRLPVMQEDEFIPVE
jgi:signal transduction histidine kinase